MRRSWFVLTLAFACAGAGPETVADSRAADAAPPAPPRPLPKFDAKSIVDTQLSPADCELVAREMRQRDRDEGWAVLNACADRRRWPRGGFTQLDALTNGRAFRSSRSPRRSSSRARTRGAG